MNTLFANQQKGLSLIELMISVALGTIIALGVVTIYSDNLQSYRLQESLSRLQENGRFAAHFLAKDIRMADHTGCANIPVKALGVTITTTVGATTTTVDAVGINGINGAEPALGATDKYDAPDTITVVFAKNEGIVLTGEPVVDTAEYAIGKANISPNHGLKVGDTIILSDCTKATAFKITGPGVDGAEITATEIDFIALTTGAPSYDKNAAFLALSTVEYTIHDPDGSATLRVKRDGGNSTPLVDGVENMQILYGQNIGGGEANYLPAAAVGAGLDMEDVKSVKISLVLASSEDVTINPVPYTIFGKEEKKVTPTDHKFRQVFTQTVALRNRLP